ncbi:putative RNA 3'-terminal phosphate cyclase-like protein [Bienertia sinuspersici]
MEKKYLKMKGSQNLRAILLLSTLSSTPILIDDIRSTDINPGLRPYEVSLLRLIEKVCNNCSVVINETGTKLKYKPGIVMGGKFLEHDCGLSRSIGYFLEVLIVLGLFGKNPLQITLKGITNDSKDPSVDAFKSTTLNILKRFGVSSQGLALKIQSRGVPPMGGGQVVLSIPILHTSLTAVNWIDEGMVRRIRGVSFSTRVSPKLEPALVCSARGIFNKFLPDVYIFTDHMGAAQVGTSPGYGVSLVAETTSQCFISADTAVHRPHKEETAEMEDDVEVSLKSAEDVGVNIATALLREIEQGGVVDSTHQGLLFILCALCPQDVSKVRVGKLSPYGIEILRLVKEFLGVKFDIKSDPSTGTLILKCVGCGLKNLSRKFS